MPAQYVQGKINSVGQRKEVLEKSCEEYAFDIKIQVYKDGSIILLMNGTVCVAREIPESKESAEFAGQAQMRGLILGLTSENPTFIALARAQTELYRLVGQLGGLALTTDSKIKFEGGVLAGLLNKTGSGERTSDVTALSLDPIPDGQFTVPSGWKIRAK